MKFVKCPPLLASSERCASGSPHAKWSQTNSACPSQGHLTRQKPHGGDPNCYGTTSLWQDKKHWISPIAKLNISWNRSAINIHCNLFGRFDCIQIMLHCLTWELPSANGQEMLLTLPYCLNCLNSLSVSALRSSYNTEDVVPKISKQVLFDKAFEPQLAGNAGNSINSINSSENFGGIPYITPCIPYIPKKSKKWKFHQFPSKFQKCIPIQKIQKQAKLLVESVDSDYLRLRPLHLWFPSPTPTLTHGSWGSPEFWRILAPLQHLAASYDLNLFQLFYPKMSKILDLSGMLYILFCWLAFIVRLQTQASTVPVAPSLDRLLICF